MLEAQPKWKSNLPKQLLKQLISTISQLKLGHGYFRSYLYRFRSEYQSDQCLNYHTRETPAHLVLSCSRTSEIRQEVKLKYKLDLLNWKFVCQTELGLKFLVDYLKASKVATRHWLLETA